MTSNAHKDSTQSHAQRLSTVEERYSLRPFTDVTVKYSRPSSRRKHAQWRRRDRRRSKVTSDTVPNTAHH